jgi:separase
MPILRKRSVSRIPSLSFLVDRLKMAEIRQSDKISAKKSLKGGRMSLDPRKVYYILNPEGDLKRTEDTFTPWLKQMKNVGWNGTIGRRPTEFELSNALSTADLFM